MRCRRLLFALTLLGCCLTLLSLSRERSFAQAPMPPAVAKFVKDLHSPNAGVRRSAASALRQMGTSAASAIPALIAALKDQDSDVRISAADALGKMNPVAASVVPALIDLLKDKDRDVRYKPFMR